jgi:hypothetical protein
MPGQAFGLTGQLRDCWTKAPSLVLKEAMSRITAESEGQILRLKATRSRVVAAEEALRPFLVLERALS